MSHLPEIWVATKDRLLTLVDDPPDVVPDGWPQVALAGVSEGEQLKAPGTPWLFMLNDNYDRPAFGGSDKRVTKWRLTLRLAMAHLADPANAERVLMLLAEQVMSAFDLGNKLGLPDIVAGTDTTGGDWGYVPFGSVFYRTLDVHLEVTEKSLTSRSA